MWFPLKVIGYVLWKLDNLRLNYIRERNVSITNTYSGGIIGGVTTVIYPGNVTIGENSYINGGMIVASPNARIVIGNNCLISYNVHIRTDMHNYNDRKTLINKQGNSEKDVIIDDDVWIGFGAQIMPGVHIAEGSVIGAGAVVTKDTEPFGVYVGIPAKKIKERTGNK